MDVQLKAAEVYLAVVGEAVWKVRERSNQETSAVLLASLTH